MIDVAALARQAGFHRAALVPLDPPLPLARYQAWLDAGYHGEMAYLATPPHLAARTDPRALWAPAKTLLVVALAYDRHDPPVAPGLVALRGRVARYARGDDYHLVLRDRLLVLADLLRDALGRPVAARPCVDAAPLLDRAWAARGALGFVAKNTMLIAPGLGSYVLLGELLLDVELPATLPPPTPPRCGACTRCLEACPTGAFVDAYALDARRCISYLTIEHRGVIPRALRPAMGTWIFGCDVCQEVCPFNAGDGEAEPAPLAPRSLEHALPDLVRLASLPSNQLRRHVKRTALRRAPRPQLLRNVAIALGNCGDAGAVAPLGRLVEDAAPLVRAHAVWALARYATDEARAAVAARRTLERDPMVRAELDAES